jgi:RNA polymerase subunit RPABC4/transcription elongation factor Spt4
MAVPIPFTDNYEDLSTDKGFQFKFNCERCGNGHMSSFQYNVTGIAGDVMRVASNFFGDMFGKAADSAYDIQRAVGGPAHDKALRTAVEEISPLFKQCPRCGNWVCTEVCYNAPRNQCAECSPKMEHEIKAIESEGTIHQLRMDAYTGAKDLRGGVELKSAVQNVQCRTCKAMVEPGQKFCGECGAPMAAAKPSCRQCGTEAPPGKKFCAECGARL